MNVIPLVAAVIGAIVGGFFTLGSTYFIRKRKEKKRERKLRRALVGEVRLSNVNAVQSYTNEISDHLQSVFRSQTEDKLDQDWLDVNVKRLENVLNTNLKSKIYEENRSDIGIFRADEVDALIRYHHVMEDCRKEFKELKFHINNGSLDGGDAEFLKHSLSQLKAEKNRLLDILDADKFEEPEGYADIREMAERE